MTRTEPSSEHCQYRLSPYFYLWCMHWYSFPTDLECVEDLWTWRSFLLQLLECLALQFRFHVWLERHSVSAFNTSLGACRRGEPGGRGGLSVTMKGVKIALLQGDNNRCQWGKNGHSQTHITETCRISPEEFLNWWCRSAFLQAIRFPGGVRVNRAVAIVLNDLLSVWLHGDHGGSSQLGCTTTELHAHCMLAPCCTVAVTHAPSLVWVNMDTLKRVVLKNLMYHIGPRWR